MAAATPISWMKEIELVVKEPMATASRIAAAVIEWLEPDLEGGVTDGLAEALADLLPVSRWAAPGIPRRRRTSSRSIRTARAGAPHARPGGCAPLGRGHVHRIRPELRRRRAGPRA